MAWVSLNGCQHLHTDLRELNQGTEKRVVQAKAMGMELKRQKTTVSLVPDTTRAKFAQRIWTWRLTDGSSIPPRAWSRSIS